MFFNQPKKDYYKDLKPSVRKHNQKKLYEMWGSDDYVKTKKGKERTKFKKYNMDMAAAYDRATYEGGNVNNAMQEVNKQYGYQTYYSYFLGDMADFAKQKKVKPPVDEKKKEKRGWNNWEKARELRSAVSTGQRVSQDIRGWLSFANNAKRMVGG
jgi:hypothetical protein